MRSSVVQYANKIALTLAVTLLLAALASPPLARAQDLPGVTMAVKAGFDGYYKPNFWIPLQITVENNGPGLEGHLEVRLPRANNASAIYTYPLSLPTVSRKEVFLYVYPEGYTHFRDITVTLIAGDEKIASAAARFDLLNQNDLLFGIMAANPSAYNLLVDLTPPAGKTVVAQLQPADLPDQAPALGALDVLVISDVDTGLLTANQRQALQGWVASGGRLLVTGGPGWNKLSAGLEDLLPVRLHETRTLPDLSALGAYAGSQSIPAGRTVVATGELLAGAQVLASQAGLPLAVWRPAGHGSVTFLAPDPALEPLRHWDGLPSLYQLLLADRADKPGWSQGLQDWNSASQAASTLPGLAMPTALLFCSFLGFYVIALGPVNFLILQKLKRRELAWLSIPALVLVFSALSFLIGSQLRGGQPILNRLAIVQVFPGEDLARVDGVIGLYSPHRSTYQLEVPGAFMVHPLPTTYGATGRDWHLSTGASGTIISPIRMEVGGVSALAYQGQAQAPAFSHDLSLHIDSQGVTLQGSITNNSRLTLQHALLLAAGNSENLGALKPGETRQVRLPLTNASRANPQLRSANVPLGSYNYFTAQMTTLELISAGSNYSSDQEGNRRYSLVNAALNSSSGPAGPGGGVYLSGWSAETPLPAAIKGKRFKALDETLYLVRFQPELDFDAGQLRLPPAMFTWSLLSSAPNSDSGPYNSHLFAGRYSLEYSLAHPIQYTSIRSLTLHLKSYGSRGPSGLDISVWDFVAENWRSFPNLDWGDFSVPNPTRYVGPGGVVRLEIGSASATQNIEIEAVDLTLVVER